MKIVIGYILGALIFLFGFAVGAASCRAATPPKTEMRCQQYEDVVVRTECHSDAIEKGAGGALTGGLLGYLIGGKRGMAAGAMLGAGAGAAANKTTCVPVTERRCKLWVEVLVRE